MVKAYYGACTFEIWQFFYDSRDNFVGRQLADTGAYNESELALYSQFITPSSRVLWLGAHIDALLVPVSKKVKEVIAYEANPETFKLLVKNLEANNCHNVTAHNIAANDQSSELKFICNVNNSGGSKRFPKKMETFYWDNESSVVTIKAMPVDEHLNDSEFNFVFMDIEGSETFAMRGMPKVIAQCDVLVAEFIPHHLVSVGDVTLSDFLKPLADFKTMIVPSQKLVVHNDEIETLLFSMMSQGASDAGLIFCKKRIEVSWTTA